MAVGYRVLDIASGGALVIIGLAVCVIALLARRLTKPIIAITDLIKNASDGDFTIQATEDSQNEIGTLSKSFNKMTKKISSILTNITALTGEVVQSSGHLRHIEEEADAISRAVREISDGTEEQNSKVNQVVVRTERLEQNFEQLQEKSSLLLTNAQDTILSGEEGMQSVAELKKQNETASERMAASFEKIQLLEKQSQKI